MIRKFIVCTGLILLVSACSKSSPSSPSPSPSPSPTPSTTSVSIPVGAQALGTAAYVPNPVTVAAGSTVRWTNNDTIAHTSTSTASPAVFNSGTIPAGGSFSFTFQNAGTYSYKCSFHPGMVGTITVQ